MSHPGFKLTRAAEADFRKILLNSRDDFGDQAATRYHKLISVALKEIATNPQLQGHRDFEGNALLYHIRHSASRAAVDGIRVKNPRHFVVYRILESDVVEITRILHDKMDYERHIPL